MARRIEKDHKEFIDVYSGKIRKELKKFINNGSIFRLRGKGDRVKLTIPKIDIPHIVYGEPSDGIGRGEGGKGDVIGKDDPKGKGKAGQGHQDGVEISIDLEEVLKFMQDELELPNLKMKPYDVFEEIKIKYNDISKNGPNSLRHNKRTMLQALKRMCATGEINKLHTLPGFKDQVKLISPINDDIRYRKYKEIKIPSTNAVIFFARDGSGSMDSAKCDIVSDMCWWMELWLRRFYKRVESCYVWHDTEAEEVDQNKFYKYRAGGGTTCSSAFKFISKQFDVRFTPDKWNIYVFYFSDGDNWGDDNQVFCDTIKNKFNEDIVNLVAITQVLPYNYAGSLREYVDKNLKSSNVVTTGIGEGLNTNSSYMSWSSPSISEEERNKQILDGVKKILGKAGEEKS